MEKKRRIVSMENLEPGIKEALMKKYPSGFQPFIQRIQGIKGETLTVVPLETEDSLFLVKVKAETAKVRADDDEEEETAGDIPETSDNFSGDGDDEFSKDEEEDTGYDEPAEEYDDEDDGEEDED